MNFRRMQKDVDLWVSFFTQLHKNALIESTPSHVSNSSNNNFEAASTEGSIFDTNACLCNMQYVTQLKWCVEYHS